MACIFYRTPESKGALAKLPVLNQVNVIDGLAKRLAEIIPQIKPDVLHAHSPSLNAIAALRAGKRFGIPVVYEVRAFWEDAAVDHGTSTENGLRYRADARARDLCAEAGRRRHHDLRRPAQGHRRARRPGRQGHGHPERGRHRQILDRRHAPTSA